MSAIWDSWQQELERVIDAGDKRVVGLPRFRAKGRGSAVPVEVPWAMVATLRNGRIVTSRVFLSRDDALEAAGLEGVAHAREPRPRALDLRGPASNLLTPPMRHE